jgi:hypothetical protein
MLDDASQAFRLPLQLFQQLAVQRRTRSAPDRFGLSGPG